MTDALRKVTPTPIHDAMVAWTHMQIDRGALIGELLDLAPVIDWAEVEDIRRTRQDQLREAEAIAAGQDPDRIAVARRVLADDPGNLVYGVVVAAFDRRLPDLRRSASDSVARLRRMLQAIEDQVATPPRPRYAVDSLDWECPVDNGRGVIVGNVDLVATVTYRRARFDAIESDWRLRDETCRIYFDAKPELPSVGALLRQINRYRHYVKDGLWVVVSPEARFAGLLASQGVKLIVPGPLPELLAESLPS